MPKPDAAAWWRIANDFEDAWEFPNCIGAIDGKHVQIQCPPRSGSLYHNFKGFFSIVLMAVVDANYRFICVDIGDLGSNSDGGIFSNSKFGKAFLEHKLDIPSGRTLPGMTPAYRIPLVLIGDEAFPSRPDLLRPYPGRKDFKLTPQQEEYNARLSRARRIVENAFGIMTQRFRIYQRRIQLFPPTAVKIVQATVVLHNFLTDVDLELHDLYKHLDRNPHLNTQQKCGNRHLGLVDMPNMRGEHPGHEALRVRHAFTAFFNSRIGQLPF